jgi:hypothetical protein
MRSGDSEVTGGTVPSGRDTRLPPSR